MTERSFSTAAQEAEVYSVRELARATGSTLAEVSAWIEVGAIRALPVGDGATWLNAAEATRAGRAILAGTIAATLPSRRRESALFDGQSDSSRLLRTPLAVSSGLHAGLVVAVILATTLGLGRASAVSESESLEPQKTRLVYLALPGPGGGGGGGGERARTPAPKARRQGVAPVSSPVPPRVTPPAPAPPEPEPQTPPEPLPPVEAPVATVAADPQTSPGVVEQPPPAPQTRGQGEGGGAGSGEGTGLGEGQGSGIGEGSGGGTGGGPFRPGSGIEPPSLLREVKPDYSEEARRRGIEGDVVMEIVVEANGRVGHVRVLQGLGYGLDERAIAAVRQWTFQPATRRGTAVSVLVEVAMEFKLR
jgi:protein TonB